MKRGEGEREREREGTEGNERERRGREIERLVRGEREGNEERGEGER